MSTPATASDPAAGAAQPSETARWFTDEVHPHEPHLRSYLRGKYPTVRDVDDVIQESFLRICKARAAHTIQSAKAFLFQVARNIATDSIRKESRSPLMAVSDLSQLAVFDDRPTGLQAACSREEFALLADAIEALPTRCREIIILRKLKRVPVQEIAQRMGISEGTVTIQIGKGVKRCGEYLVRHGICDENRG